LRADTDIEASSNSTSESGSDFSDEQKAEARERGRTVGNTKSRGMKKCSGRCETMQCAAFKNIVDASELKKGYDNLSREEKGQKVWRDVQAAMYWDPRGRKWEYTFTTCFMRVCSAVWVPAHGLSWSFFYQVKREVEDAANEARVTGDTHVGARLMGVAERVRKNTSSSAALIVAWLHAYAQSMGEKLPTPLTATNLDDMIVNEDENCEIRLPHARKEDVFDEYALHCRLHGESCVSKGYFLRIWRKGLGNVKCSKSKGSFAMCDICASCTGKMKNAANKVEYEEWKKKRDDHFTLQREQRRVYYQNRLKGQRQPTEVLSMIIDAMDQKKTELPVMNRKKKKDSNMQFIKQKIMAVIAHGHGRYLYAAHPPLPTGANFTIECLWRTLMKLDDEHTGRGECLPKRLIVQMDNASDNKANAMLCFASHLVEGGVFEEVELNFLMVGHTHEDIDQMFSVISSRLKGLVHTAGATRSVISFEDFQGEVADAFRDPKYKPRCVEKVHANHDFTEWFAPYLDKRLAGITQFRHFSFKMVTIPDLHGWEEAIPAELAGKALLRGKQFMSYEDSKYKPDAASVQANGPLVVLRTGMVEGEPVLEEFKDLSIPTSRHGVVNILPPQYQGKGSAAILEMRKQEWEAWVNDDGNGASEEQKRSFGELLRNMAATVDTLPAEVRRNLPRWRLPLAIHYRGALPILDNAGANGEAMRENVIHTPSPRFAYGNVSLYRANREAREHARIVEARSEMNHSLVEMACIKKGEIVLVKNVVSENEGEEDGYEERKGDGVEWWLGRAEKAYEVVSREEEGANERVCIQWMYGKAGKAQAQVNDLNAKFVPWVIPRGDPRAGKAKNKKNVEEVDRAAIAMIGVELKRDGQIKVCSKKAIGDLGIGYEFDNKQNVLEYRCEDTEAEAVAM
jgi:hypothetical protein